MTYISYRPWQWFKKESITVEVETPKKPFATESPMPSIVLIHGANQTNTSFEFIRHALPGFRYINIDWSAYTDFQSNLSEMVSAVKGTYHTTKYINKVVRMYVRSSIPERVNRRKKWQIKR